MPYQFNPFTGTFDLVNPDDSVKLTGNQTIKGIKTFAEKLLLPNCTFINGVARFEQSTKPTQRVFLVNDIVVNEPLVIGDRWYKTNDGSEWFWNGTYWLENVLQSCTGSGQSILRATGLRLYTINAYGANNLKAAVFVESVALISTPGQLVQFGDANNYKNFRFSLWHQGGSGILLYQSPQSNNLSNSGFSATLNTVAFLNGFQVSSTTVGSPVNHNPDQIFYYRNYYPL